MRSPGPCFIGAGLEGLVRLRPYIDPWRGCHNPPIVPKFLTAEERATQKAEAQANYWSLQQAATAQQAARGYAEGLQQSVLGQAFGGRLW
jgi:flagellar biosynthesis/type III secretory pathway protein FliH